MTPYKTARVICTYKCNKKCAGCVNQADIKVPPIGLVDLARFDEIILTGGEPLNFPTKLLELIDSLDNSRIILYTNSPSYPQLFAISQFLAGITITIHDNEDAFRFNRSFGRFFGDPNKWRLPLIFIRIYEPVSIRVQIFPTAQYKMCKWVHPEECKLQPNEELFRLRELWV